MTLKREPRRPDTDEPHVLLRATGDGASLYRALARVLVRREITFTSAISDEVPCEPRRAAG
jgi:hypothetical protein